MLLLISACGVRSLSIPEELDRMKAAVVRAWSPAPGKILVQAIDGSSTQGASYVYVAPGEHSITVRWSNEQAISRFGQLSVKLQSGHYYVVEAEPDGALRTVLFTLVDKGTNYDEECLLQRTFGREAKGRNC